jgi:hypothetical protein
MVLEELRARQAVPTLFDVLNNDEPEPQPDRAGTAAS